MGNHKKAAWIIVGILIAALSIGAAVALATADQTPQAQPLTLENVGNYATQMTQQKQTQLPPGLMGTGVRLSDRDGTSLTGENGELRAGEDSLFLFARLYNANAYQNTVTLFFLIDDQQPAYRIDTETRAAHTYEMEMPPMSYADIPVMLNIASLGLEAGVHDLWCLCKNTAVISLGQSDKHIPTVTAAHLRLLLDDGGYWADNRTFDIPGGTLDDAMAKSVDRSMQLIGPLAAEDAHVLAYPSENPFQGEARLYIRSGERWQTFLLLNGKAVPFSKGRSSVLWVAAGDKRLFVDIRTDLPQDAEFAEFYLLSLPVGHENVPILSQRYAVIQK